MKIKIRKYEQLLISLLGLMTIINYLLQHLGFAQIYTAGFSDYLNSHPDLNLNYSANLLFPRVGIVLLLMTVYFWINLFTIPQLRRATFRSFFIYPWVLIQIAGLSYLLAVGVNIASDYAHPAWNNYGEFRLFALFGYNELPLNNLWAGFDRALIFVAIYTVYAALRDFAVYRIENPDSRSNYRILIANQICATLFIFLLLPVLVASFHIIEDDTAYRAYFIHVPPVIFVYFSNTYWLFPHFANPRGISYQFIWHLAISTFFYSLPFLGLLFLIHSEVRPFAWLIVWLINWIILLIIITPITWMLYQQQKDKIQELINAEMALTKSTADLQFLRSQINPHFLFNILNTLYGTALVDGSKRTANGIQMLGDMMRFMLEDNHLDFIPLNSELNYLRNYITLQKLRIQESAEVEITEHITVEDCNYQIIPMLLIPFVENAFKHGINLNQKSWININLTCSPENINLKVRNSLHLQETNDPEKKHTGIGLRNVKDRLKLFYKGRHQLNYTTTENEFIIELMIKPETKIHETTAGNSYRR